MRICLCIVSLFTIVFTTPVYFTIDANFEKSSIVKEDYLNPEVDLNQTQEYVIMVDLDLPPGGHGYYEDDPPELDHFYIEFLAGPDPILNQNHSSFYDFDHSFAGTGISFNPSSIWADDFTRFEFSCSDPNTGNLSSSDLVEVNHFNFLSPFSDIQIGDYVSISHYQNQIAGYVLFYGSVRSISTTNPLASNSIPAVNAGSNTTITSAEINSINIVGNASDEDPDEILQYRWLEGTNVLLGWQNIGPEGTCLLDLSLITIMAIGQHTLILEVTDSKATVSDEMILTIENSAPTVNSNNGSITAEINTPIYLTGEVIDHDGDGVDYEWKIVNEIICYNSIQTIAGGTSITLPECYINFPELGTYTLTLSANDGINDAEPKIVSIKIVDKTKPTLAPVSNKAILWPPNHKMVDIVIEANAHDNSGVVTLSASIISDEPHKGLGYYDISPDWTEPVIVQSTGLISFQLRSERSGTKDGRTYTVIISASDGIGNMSTANVEIIVPHNKDH